VGDNPHLI